MSITNKEIEEDLIRYLKNGNPNLSNMKDMPMDKSLVELGHMDSFGVIDLVTYLESKWKVKIEIRKLPKINLVQLIKW